MAQPFEVPVGIVTALIKSFITISGLFVYACGELQKSHTLLPMSIVEGVNAYKPLSKEPLITYYQRGYFRS